jgi:hypothetical protein
MSLTSRAQHYLATLKRGEPVPIGIVAESLQRNNCPFFDVWKEFHLRFAGYEEEIGAEKAVWGLAHADPLWGEPWEVDVEPDGPDLLIVCADVHPSYNYVLDQHGEFPAFGGGGPCESFEIKIERDSAFWQAELENRSWTIEPKLEKIADAICERFAAIIVPEASDKYATLWSSHEAFVLKSGDRATVWVATDTRERIISLRDQLTR